MILWLGNILLQYPDGKVRKTFITISGLKSLLHSYSSCWFKFINSQLHAKFSDVMYITLIITQCLLLPSYLGINLCTVCTCTLNMRYMYSLLRSWNSLVWFGSSSVSVIKEKNARTVNSHFFLVNKTGHKNIFKRIMPNNFM